MDSLIPQRAHVGWLWSVCQHSINPFSFWPSPSVRNQGQGCTPPLWCSLFLCCVSHLFACTFFCVVWAIFLLALFFVLYEPSFCLHFFLWCVSHLFACTFFCGVWAICLPALCIALLMLDGSSVCDAVCEANMAQVKSCRDAPNRRISSGVRFKSCVWQRLIRLQVNGCIRY